jgi:hypothetical protein
VLPLNGVYAVEGSTKYLRRFSDTKFGEASRATRGYSEDTASGWTPLAFRGIAVKSENAKTNPLNVGNSGTFPFRMYNQRRCRMI